MRFHLYDQPEGGAQEPEQHVTSFQTDSLGPTALTSLQPCTDNGSAVESPAWMSDFITQASTHTLADSVSASSSIALFLHFCKLRV